MGMRALVRELIETVILALAIFLVLQFSVQNFRVEGSSMVPTLIEGDYLIVNKIIYLRFTPEELGALLPFYGGDRDESLFAFHKPRHGEVIVFHFPRDPSRDFVKRVIGVPGDVVQIERGTVILNGEALIEPYLERGDRSSLDEQTVPADSFFVLGDNRRASNDSRDWGFVPSEQIVGRAWFGYWPLDKIRSLQVFRLP